MRSADAMHEPTLAAYLARLDAELAGVPAGERRDILLETRSHVVEQVGRVPARRVEEVLAELGAPEAYARQFLGDAEAAPPPADAPHGSTVLFGLAQLTTRGARALPWLLVFGLLYVLAGIALLFVIGELIDPAGTGVFVQPRPDAPPRVLVVISGEEGTGGDVLGRALVPVGLLVAGAVHLGARALLRRLLRSRAHRA